VGISEGQWNLVQSRRATEVEAITANDSGVAVPAGKVLYGVDAAGHRHLLVPVHGNDVAEDRESQGVQVGVRKLRYESVTTLYADLSCTRPQFNAEFAHIVSDVLEALRNGAAAHTACRNSLEKWRDLLKSPRTRGLDEPAATGLFGELALLAELVAVSPRAVNSWTGPSGGRFDFSGSDTAIEVKTSTRRYGRIAEINGETQLDAPPGLDLYLHFARLETVPAGGNRLWDLYTSILQAGVPHGEMQRKLADASLDDSVIQDDQRRYRVLETRLYPVDRTFPKIVPASFVGGQLPPGTLQLRYVIDISGEPPMPLDAQARVSILRRLLQAGGNA
jgi:putative PD-(D/E)XK family protein DUF4420